MEDRTDFRRFLSASSGVFAVRIVAAGAAFAMNVAVTRLLGPHEAGLFFLGQGCLIILAMLSRLGTDHLLVRFVAGFTDQGQYNSATAVLVKTTKVVVPAALVMSVGMSCLADPIATTLFSKPDFASVLRWVSLCIVPYSIFQLLSFAIQGRQQVALSIVINATVLPFATLLTVLLADRFGIRSAADLMTFVVAVCLINAVLAGILWIRRIDSRADVQQVSWPELASTARPLFLVSVFSLANLWAPQLILAMYESADQIAMLSNSQKTATLVGFLLISINGVAAPKYAALHNRSDARALHDFAARVNGVILIATTPVLLTVFVMAPQILEIFGPTFSSSASLLRILVIGQFFNAATGSVGYLLTMSGNERHFRTATAWAALTGLGVSVLLVPTYGSVGAAIAISSSCIVANAIAAFKVYHCLQINVLKPDVQFVTCFLKRVTLKGL